MALYMDVHVYGLTIKHINVPTTHIIDSMIVIVIISRCDEGPGRRYLNVMGVQCIVCFILMGFYLNFFINFLNIEKCPFTYYVFAWLWFRQIVDMDSGNLYSISTPFPWLWFCQIVDRGSGRLVHPFMRVTN